MATRSDADHVARAGRGDCPSDFAAEASHGHACHRNVLAYLHSGPRGMVRAAFWSVRLSLGEGIPEGSQPPQLGSSLCAAVPAGGAGGRLAGRSAPQPGDRVLEIGAGPGYVSLVLADRV